MKLEQKILQAKTTRRKQFIKAGTILVSISLFCLILIFFVSTQQFNNENTETSLTTGHDEFVYQSVEIPNEQLRQAYIDGLSDYENNLKPELDKIDLEKWNKAISEQLVSLKNKALAEFTASRYLAAKSVIEELNQLAQDTITESRKEFEIALSRAQISYDVDQYDEAKQQITHALMLDNTSIDATTLSTKIDKLPEILPQLESIKAAKTEKNLDKELFLIRELLKLAPERTVAIKRKQVLINAINKRNFNTYIAQANQALKKHDIQTVKKKVGLAKKIFPKHQKIRDVTLALNKIEKKKRFSIYQQKAQLAINTDQWSTAKKQLELALQEQPDDTESQKSLSIATKIIALNTEFKQYINDPYRLANKLLGLKLESKISKAVAFASRSPSLSKNKDTLSRLIKKINKKITVQVISDNKTYILVRGIGKVGKTQSKTIQLLPGKYTFEGKRKGFKSKLMAVLIPYDKTSFKLTILCDEPI